MKRIGLLSLALAAAAGLALLVGVAVLEGAPAQVAEPSDGAARPVAATEPAVATEPVAAAEPAPATEPALAAEPAAAAGPAAATAVLPASPSARPEAVAAPESRAAAASADLGPVREAVAAYRKGDVAAGDALRARLEDPGARLLLDWLAVRTGGPGIDLGRVLAFGRAYPDFPGQTWLRRRAEETLLRERKPDAVVRAFFARERPQTAAGKLVLAQALRADGLGEDAASLVRDAWRYDLFGREVESRILDGFKDALTAADHRFRTERLLLKENWAGARRAAEMAGPGFEALVKARVAVDGRAKNAGKLLDAVPAGLRDDPSWLYSRAQLLRRAGQIKEAAEVLAKAGRDPERLVDGDAWWIERRLVARELLDAGSPQDAYQVAIGHGAVGDERRIEAEFHAGWIALRFLKEPALAARHFERAAAVAGTPISLARVAYWQGRTAEAAGDAARARGFYRDAARQGTTYYGQLAGAKLGHEQLPLRPVSNPAGPDRIRAARDPVVRAVATAYAAGFRELALPLAVELGRNGRDVAVLEAAADVLAEQRDTRALLVFGKAATQRGMALEEAAFPVGGIPAFDAVGANRVERAMVHAIARQESAFDPAAQSGAGARGLMQLMPGTAQLTARKAGIEYEPTRLGDAAYNASLGAAHLGDLMADWRGSFVLTFASYNAGPGNARKWINAYGDPRDPSVDTVDWVERIPFSETRNYVQRVMENLQVYRKRLDGRSALLIESDLKGGARRPPSATP